MVAWVQQGESYAGCIGGYSGGGAFQLEKFVILDKTIFLESGNFPDYLANSRLMGAAEDCQDFILSHHDEREWLDFESLILKERQMETLDDESGLLFGGTVVPQSLILLFPAAGLISRPRGVIAMSKNFSIHLNLDADFEIVVPASDSGQFQKDQKNGQISCGIFLRIEGVDYNYNIYPDDFVEGKMQISKATGDRVRLKLAGAAVKDLDPAYEAEVISALGQGPMEIFFESLGDLEGNSYDQSEYTDQPMTVGSATLSG